MIKDIKTVVFDWDGTLHESMFIYEKAFRKAYQFLVENGYTKPRLFTKEDISSFLGKNPKEMWTHVLPDTDDVYIQKASQIISNEMLESIEKGEARLYEHTIDVLTYLKKKGYHLVYLSNSKNYYMEAMKKAFHLNHYFDRFVTSEMYAFIPKKMILKEILHELEPSVIMIGDRDIDIETGQYNQLLTIGCLYGYGTPEELIDADYLITDLIHLKTML